MEETFKGGDGKTCDTAVIIVAKGEYQGLVAEHYWLNINYPEYEITGQALAGYNNKPHDIIMPESVYCGNEWRFTRCQYTLWSESIMEELFVFILVRCHWMSSFTRQSGSNNEKIFEMAEAGIFSLQEDFVPSYLLFRTHES